MSYLGPKQTRYLPPGSWKNCSTRPWTPLRDILVNHMKRLKRYSELIQLKTYDERFRYLKMSAQVGQATFGFERYLNQAFYKSREWQDIRRDVIIRDNGCDLGVEGYDILDKILIHHMNPITQEDILDRNPDILNPEFLICVNQRTHNALHFGDESILKSAVVERTPWDTCPWKKERRA